MRKEKKESSCDRRLRILKFLGGQEDLRYWKERVLPNPSRHADIKEMLGSRK